MSRVLAGRIILFLLICAFVSQYNYTCAQSLGDPVVHITFGSGTATRGPALAADSGSTTYVYTNGGNIGENYYTITNLCNTNVHSGFVTSYDHGYVTTGKTDGYMMVVNGNIDAGTVFTRAVPGLCGNTSYQFGVWIQNVLTTAGSIPPNMVFHIYASDGTTELGSGVSTGNVAVGSGWQPYTANFTLPAGTNGVVIKLVSNASGTIGNDFAVDDITFSPYDTQSVAVVFDDATSSTTKSTCSGTTQTYTIKATSTLGANHVQKLQAYINGVWVDQSAASTQTSFTVTPPTAAGTYYYRLVTAITDNIGSASCVTSSNQLTLTVTAGPTAAITAPDNTCLGSPTVFTDASTSNGGTITGWVWNFGDGQTSTQQNPSHTYATAGLYPVKLTATNSNGCQSDPITKQIAINAVATAAFSISSPACETRAVTITDASTAGTGTITTWLWDYGDGKTETKTDGSAFQYTYAAYGTYTVKLIVTTSVGCTATKSQSVTVYPLPQVDFITPSICQSDGAAKFTNKTTIADGSALTYTWDFGDGSATSNALNATHLYSAAGAYTLTLTVSASNRCPVTLSKSFYINGSNPTPVLLPRSTTVCSDHEAFFTNQSTVVPGIVTSIDIYYDWANDKATKESFAFPTYGQEFRHSYPVFHTGAAKTYTVHMIAYSGANSSSCLNSTDVIISVLPVADLSFPALQDVCVDKGVVTLGATENSGLTGTGTYYGPGVINTATGGLFNPATAGVGKWEISYVFNAANYCADTIKQTITVKPIPTVSAGATMTVLEGGSAVIPAKATGDGLTYTWSPATNLSSTTVLNPTVYPSTTDITYTLTVKNTEGCSESDTITVKTLRKPVVPNTFTPNADGVNDTWEIKYLNSYLDCTVDIFNRNGQKVYNSIGYPTNWDGSYNGSPLPTGTYYYIINPKHGRTLLSGSITIIR